MSWHGRVFWLAIFVLAGCTTSQIPDAETGVTTVSPAVTSMQVGALQVGAPPQPSASTPQPTDGKGDYRIGALDMLEITVFKVPELNKTLQVSSAGEIRLPLIGTLPASGRTVRELEADITRRLEADYLQSAQVGVYVKDAISQRVTVEGAVNKPGIYSAAKGQATLLQVIALAGGPTRLANERQILVFRQLGGKRSAAIFNYSNIRSGKAEDPVIHGGDVVVVDQSGVKAGWRNLIESLGVIKTFTPL